MILVRKGVSTKAASRIMFARFPCWSRRILISDPLLSRRYIGGGSIKTFEIPRDCQDADNDVVELQIREQFTMPPGGGGVSNNAGDLTGRFVWPSSMPLLQRLQRDFLAPDGKGQESPSKNIRILELGSGCGLLGIGIQVLGGSKVEVILSEHGGAVKWLKTNIEQNEALFERTPTAICLDWRKFNSIDSHVGLVDEEDFDLIVGSDILYDSNLHQALTNTIARLSSSKTLVYVAYPQRSGNEASFLNATEEFFDLVSLEDIQTLATSAPCRLAILRKKAHATKL